MSEPPPILSYATPSRGVGKKWLRGLLFFWVAAVGSATAEAAVTIFGPQGDWNLYLGPHLCFVIISVEASILFATMVGLMVGAVAFVRWLAPRLDVRESIAFWIAGGVCYGLACTVPRAIDVAFSDHKRDPGGGSLNTNGWGGAVQIAYFFLVPVVTLVLAFRRGRQGILDDGR